MLTRWSRVAAAVIAFVFAGCVVIQVFLAGLSLFASGTHWADHRAFGSVIALPPLSLPVLAAAGRLPFRLVALAALILPLYALQFVFVHAGVGALAALHPVNALLLFSLSITVGRRIARHAAPSPGASRTNQPALLGDAAKRV